MYNLCTLLKFYSKEESILPDLINLRFGKSNFVTVDVRRLFIGTHANHLYYKQIG